LVLSAQPRVRALVFARIGFAPSSRARERECHVAGRALRVRRRKGRILLLTSVLASSRLSRGARRGLTVNVSCDMKTSLVVGRTSVGQEKEARRGHKSSWMFVGLPHYGSRAAPDRRSRSNLASGAPASIVHTKSFPQTLRKKAFRETPIPSPWPQTESAWVAGFQKWPRGFRQEMILMRFANIRKFTTHAIGKCREGFPLSRDAGDAQ